MSRFSKLKKLARRLGVIKAPPPPSPPEEKRKPVFGYMVNQEDPDFLRWVDLTLPHAIELAGVSVDGKAGKWPNMLRKTSASILDLDMSRFEASIKYAEERGQWAKWHQGVGFKPKWVPQEGYDLRNVASRTRDNLRFLETVLRDYGDRLDLIDLVNEPFDPQARGFRFAPGFDPITVAEIEGYFKFAREHTRASLGLNEYGCERPGHKHDLLVALAKSLLDRGAPLDRVGLQGHLRAWEAPTYQEWCDAIGPFKELGLEVDITELDCRVYAPESGLSEQELSSRAKEAVESAMRAAVDMEVQHVITWGISDRKSWVPEKFGVPVGKAKPLPFGSMGETKPFWKAIERAVR